MQQQKGFAEHLLTQSAPNYQLGPLQAVIKWIWGLLPRRGCSRWFYPGNWKQREHSSYQQPASLQSIAAHSKGFATARCLPAACTPSPPDVEAPDQILTPGKQQCLQGKSTWEATVPCAGATSAWLPVAKPPRATELEAGGDRGCLRAGSGPPGLGRRRQDKPPRRPPSSSHRVPSVLLTPNPGGPPG